ncbi:coiled-coil domain-containing protein 42 homolog [Ctenocephalides felis]|uniref:coiled-coil domain-containing protein 42 homolog n=1 Tax=Ctenocephalides felis TaxID=7515 RepID=UPI000E6E510B|nr:coiled-coil domain-containing protein 42 homolog [Ctenocephalides felis]
MGKDILEQKSIKCVSLKRMPLESLPHKDVGDYIEAQQINRLPRRFPRWDEGRTEPALRAAITRRELYQAKKNLQDVRKAGVKARAVLQVQIDKLVAQEKDLGRNFIKFNRFIRENADKRQRAERKIAESRVINNQLKSEINELSEQYSAYMNIKNSLVNMISKYKMYETFLDKCAEESPYLTSIYSVVKRYEALMSARQVISERLNENMLALNKTVESVSRIQAEKNALIGQMKYELRMKDERHGEVTRFKNHWESAIVKISNMAYDKLAEIFCVRFSSWDLYQQLAVRRQLPITLGEFDQEGHFTFIKESILELRKCVEESKKIMKEAEEDDNDLYND